MSQKILPFFLVNLSRVSAMVGPGWMLRFFSLYLCSPQLWLHGIVSRQALWNKAAPTLPQASKAGADSHIYVFEKMLVILLFLQEEE